MKKQQTLLNLCYEYSEDEINLEEKEWYAAKHLVNIFDVYAIDFAEWYLDLWNRNDLAFENNSPKQLLEIFKKYKGL